VRQSHFGYQLIVISVAVNINRRKNRMNVRSSEIARDFVNHLVGHLARATQGWDLVANPRSLKGDEPVRILSPLQ